MTKKQALQFVDALIAQIRKDRQITCVGSRHWEETKTFPNKLRSLRSFVKNSK